MHPFIPGHRDATGLYFAYGNSAKYVEGLATNATATDYWQGRTATLNFVLIPAEPTGRITDRVDAALQGTA